MAHRTHRTVWAVPGIANTFIYGVIHRPFCPFSYRAAACRLAGSCLGQLAGCARAWRQLAGAYRRCGYHALQRTGASHHPAAVATARPGARCRRRSRGAIATGRAISASLANAGGARLGLPLHLLAPPDCAGFAQPRRRARAAWGAGLPRHMPASGRVCMGCGGSVCTQPAAPWAAASWSAACVALARGRLPATARVGARCRHRLARPFHGCTAANRGAGRR